MKIHTLPFPVRLEDLDRSSDPRTSLAISSLLPGVKAGEEPLSRDTILFEASSQEAPTMTASSMTQRLVVLVPENELDEDELARHLWLLAAPGGLEVLFVSLKPEPGSEAYQRLRLASLVSLVRDERVKAAYTFAAEENWTEAARQIWRLGDLLVCVLGQTARGQIRNNRDLARQISASLAVPVYEMSGLRLGPSLGQIQKRKEWVAWMGFLITLAAFGWIQLQIQRSMVGSSWTIFMALSVLVELAFLWKINERTL